MVVLAANGVESARLLLHSHSALFPQGLANGWGHVGRHYLRHVVQTVWSIFDQPVHMHRGEVMAGLMSEGTLHRSSVELAETVESVGATLFTRGGVDTARVRLLTLSRFFPDLIGVVRDVIEHPAFDPNELSTYTDNKVERLKIDLRKNEVLAYRHLTETIFGPDHPYGQNVFPEHYQAIDTHDLRAQAERMLALALETSGAGYGFIADIDASNAITGGVRYKF